MATFTRGLTEVDVGCGDAGLEPWTVALLSGTMPLSHILCHVKLTNQQNQEQKLSNLDNDQVLPCYAYNYLLFNIRIYLNLSY
jgi:hypothetical protein